MSGKGSSNDPYVINNDWQFIKKNI
jgi:hypothetical protein